MISQNVQFSVGADVRNAIVGSKPTNNCAKPNLLFEFAMVSNNNVEITLAYEVFNAIKFDKYTIQAGYQFEPIERFKIIPSVSFNIIDRWGSEWGRVSSHLALGGNLGLRYELNDNFDIELMCQALNRSDLNTKYGGNTTKISNFLKIIYKINL